MLFKIFFVEFCTLTARSASGPAARTTTASASGPAARTTSGSASVSASGPAGRSAVVTAAESVAMSEALSYKIRCQVINYKYKNHCNSLDISALFYTMNFVSLLFCFTLVAGLQWDLCLYICILSTCVRGEPQKGMIHSHIHRQKVLYWRILWLFMICYKIWLLSNICSKCAYPDGG